MRLVSFLSHILRVSRSCIAVAHDGLRWLRLAALPSSAVAARLLLAEKQLTMYQEREVKPRRARLSERVTIALLSRFVDDWRQRLVVVKADTVCRWHRQLGSLLWRRRSCLGGRPPLPHEIRAVIARIHRENPLWSPRRIRDEARLKLGVRVAEATVRKYLGEGGSATPDRGQRWATFIRNHAAEVVACDLLTVWTARFQVLYVLVVMEVGSRRLLHVGVTSAPAASWIEQQLREAVPSDHSWRFLVHDRDGVFSRRVDDTAMGLGLKVQLTPPRAPQANSFCERLIGTLRRVLPTGTMRRILTVGGGSGELDEVAQVAQGPSLCGTVWHPTTRR